MWPSQCLYPIGSRSLIRPRDAIVKLSLEGRFVGRMCINTHKSNCSNHFRQPDGSSGASAVTALVVIYLLILLLRLIVNYAAVQMGTERRYLKMRICCA